MTGSDSPPDFDQMGIQLEQQEIESPGGIASPQVYGQLLAIYLLQNDLPNAKFIWKRIPQALKTANTELALVWAVGQKLWNRDLPGVYEALNKEWPEHLKSVMTTLGEITQTRACNLIAQAYSSVSAEDFATIMGMTVPVAVEYATAKGWQADAQTRLLHPKKSDPPSETAIPSEQQLSRLTDFVSFLEN